MAKPLSARKSDILYLVFFVIHIPVMLLVDLAPYYPPSIRPAITIHIRDFYRTSYRDRFFISPPPWFHAYTALEAVYHIPLSLWAIRAIIRDDVQVPLHLLVFACETAITTLTCTVEMLSWENYTREEQMRLAGLYVPYLVLAMVMGGDMFLRLRRTLVDHAGLVSGKKYM